MGLESTQDKYEFFQNMDGSSMYKAVKSVSNGARNESPSVKSFINCTSSEITGNAETVCKKFNKLISSFCSSELEMASDKQLNSSDYKYLNFWANFELNGEHFVDNSSIESFRNLMNNEDYERFSKEKMKAVLEHIEEEDLKRMKILDNLYQRYYEMQEIIFSTSEERFEKCLRYSSECFNEYRNAFSTDEIGKYFNSALTNFKKAYEELVSKAFSKDTSYVSYIAKIPEDPNESELSFYTIGDRRNKIILISLFGSVIAVVLVLIYFYKFTHFGTLIRARSRKKKKKFHNQDDNMKNSQCTNDPNIISYNNRKYNLAYHSARNS